MTLASLNVDCPPGTVFTFSGLVGAKAQEPIQVVLAGSSASAFVNEQAYFDPKGGTLKITIAAGKYVTLRTDISITFPLDVYGNWSVSSIVLKGSGNVSIFGENASSFVSMSGNISLF